ncbi:RluA family pseudouridine synthase [Kineothrix sp. MSJ-39]|uniref:RluA family pseudouridine synthase n=1 Tax=Kineothrix sp. MSJ-39 TaxID=2841533 RepID=UPI001C10D617|nr:RluA family pseudouridine synthase [Kineothrix sp. MSJ-39]MBU5430672.1 RluA family pseudouridine synthase [Kineothrix sp. MSJ-39]
MMQTITDNDIQYEDKDLLVVYKPAGLATQSARVTSPDLVSAVTRHLKGAPVYVVHRLDQPVEGLLVLAKTKQAAAGLNKQLLAGTLNKQYYALVHWAEELPAEGTLVDYLWKNPQTQKAEIVAQASGKGKQAKLQYRLLTKEADTALLDVRIETGRFHQIRAQLAHAGFPILGDQKYGTQASTERSKELGIKNVSLFAYALAFTHPKTGKQMEFQVNSQNPAISHLLTTMN